MASSRSSSPSFTRFRVRKLIDQIAAANQLCESASVSFSRVCRGCSSASPSHASVACGHAVCGSCADGKTECPGCKQATRFVKLVKVDRSCCICLSDFPRFVDIFSGCGHSICSSCSKQMQQESSSTTAISCSLCRVVSAPFSLIETANGVPQGAFPDASSASVVFEAFEKLSQRRSSAARNSDVLRAENMASYQRFVRALRRNGLGRMAANILSPRQ